jgi:signal transduction histidine kinase
MRLVNERLLLTALREHDEAIAAEVARVRAEFLASASLRFGASLDQEVTYAVIAGLALPGLRGWCVVDVVETGGGLRRLAVMHPDAEKQVAARALVERWIPSPDDRIGIPAVAATRRSVIVTAGADAALLSTARDADTLGVLPWLGTGSLLVVPIVAHDVLLGAITFVSDPDAPEYEPADVELGEALARRCAQALVSARLYAAARAAWGEADAARADAERLRTVAESACAEAEAASAVKTTFLRTMSHELRTPLNAINGYAQIMEMGIHGPVTAEQLSDLASIRRSQLHVLEMINAVLRYATLESGQVEYVLDSVRLSEVMTEAVALVTPQARERHISITVEPCEPDDMIRTDEQKLRQIVVNLLSNAVKFTDHGESGLEIHVRDTGIGVPSDKLEEIFQPFVQVSSSYTRSHEGSGLGLAISREFARGMGGDLTVESVPGEGSVFTVRLPLG